MAGNDAESLASQLRVYLSGDVVHKRYIIGVDQAKLAEAAAAIAPLTVDAAAVLKMLTALQSGQVILSEAQAWASFVRAGCFPQSQPGTVTPLEIGFTGVNAEAVGRIIARFDELGDLSDEPLGDAELAGMIAEMRNG